MSRRPLLSSLSGVIAVSSAASGDDEVIVELDPVQEEEQEERWSKLLPELLSEVMKRVEKGGADKWPRRRDVVACACVCRRWRNVTRDMVRSPRELGRITFPSSLKEPGPKDTTMQCYIKRNKRTSTFFLYLCLTQSFVDKGKFLLAARRYRNGAHIEYVISIDPDDLFQESSSYVGKLRSDFLGPKYHIYDSNPPYEGKKASSNRSIRRFNSKRISPQVSSDFLGTKYHVYDSNPPYEGAKASNNRSIRRFNSKRISPQVSSSNYETGFVHYKFNLLKSRGPRRMHCTLQCPTASVSSSPALSENGGDADKTPLNKAPLGNLVLKNKAPRWHEHLQCWCLNFHGRVTVASVKNFQLVSTEGDEETVLLQFGKIGDDMFTMDYRHPLSAFQAFAICLTSFGTKFACE